MTRKLFVIASAILAFAISANGTIRMPSFFANHMVLQRSVPVNIWGKSVPGKTIEVTLAGAKDKAVVNPDSSWRVTLPSHKAGGPFKLIVSGDGQLSFDDVMIGDVWVCSGQSNMEWTVGASTIYEKEIQSANYPQIRCIKFANIAAETPQWDVPSSGWRVASPESVSDFTAAGWFFALQIHQTQKVPVGIISTNWGGTAIELWISPEAIVPFEDVRNRFSNNAVSVQQRIDAQKLRNNELGNWKQYALANDAGISICPSYFSPDHNDAEWLDMKVPALWEGTGLPGFDGVVWFRKKVMLSPAAGQDFILDIGMVDDYDEVYFNGYKVGSTDGYNISRRYTVPASLVKDGENLLAIRVMDYGGGGGLNSTNIAVYQANGSNKVVLNGEWKFRVGFDFDVMNDYVQPDYSIMSDWMPGVLYNAMINPIVPYAIKGFTWYQGEANADRAYEYRTLFKAMITDWRQHWGIGDLPFMFVQLANFMNPADFPTDSEWAELREAQSMALQLPNTAMAVAIDIGEANDIHPKNKRDVGNRLALGALNRAYGEPVEYSGPEYSSMTIENGRIVLAFEHTGKGLEARGGELKQFAIAGENQKFVWASAKIDGDRVIVWSDAIADPVAVRYAWANNPEGANLYNKDGLPAAPFRTDDWLGITRGR